MKKLHEILFRKYPCLLYLIFAILILINSCQQDDIKIIKDKSIIDENEKSLYIDYTVNAKAQFIAGIKTKEYKQLQDKGFYKQYKSRAKTMGLEKSGA